MFLGFELFPIFGEIVYKEFVWNFENGNETTFLKFFGSIIEFVIWFVKESTKFNVGT